jgi:hypothetical protein
MNAISEQEYMLEFFKAMVHEDRLKIIGLLSLEALTPAQIAERLGMKGVDVLRHLQPLERLELISSEREPFPEHGHLSEAKVLYMLNVQALHDWSRRVLSGMRARPAVEEIDADEYDRKVLRDFMTADGKLKALPTQEKKLQAVLRYLAQAFEPGQQYTEKQVNEILLRTYADMTTLRRCLVDAGLLQRERGVYWRTAPAEETSQPA